jgi:hypothetical protein
LQEARKLEARAEEAMFVGVDAKSKGYRVYWPTKCQVSVECNITFALLDVVLAEDVQDEGESNVSEVCQSKTNENTPSILDTSPSPSQPVPTPTPPQPCETCPRPPPEYYAGLQRGESASVAIETLMEASELDLLDEEGHIQLTLVTAEPEPTLQQALNGPDAVEWQEVLDYEISQLEKLGTWEVVDTPSSTNIIPCHFVLATKRGPDGEKLKLHACLVANSQRQQYRVDYFDTFAPTANMITIRTVLTMAAQKDWEIHQVDIKSAYLYASIQEEIYMKAPPGYLKDGQKGKVLRLQRSLPGLKQASFEWAEELAGVFEDLGFSRSRVDQAVYFKRTKDEHVVITVSIDNMAVTANHISHIKCFKA